MVPATRRKPRELETCFDFTRCGLPYWSFKSSEYSYPLRWCENWTTAHLTSNEVHKPEKTPFLSISTNRHASEFFLHSFPVYTYNTHTYNFFPPVLDYLVPNSINLLTLSLTKQHKTNLWSHSTPKPASHININHNNFKTKTNPNPLLKILMPNSSHQPNSSPSRSPTNHNHLQRPLQPSPNIIFPPPPNHHPSLDPSKHKQSHRHNTNTPIQRHIDLIPLHAKVWNQGDQAAQEISHGDCDGAYKWSGRVGGRGLMMESH